MRASERLRELTKKASGFEFVPVNPSDLGYVQRNEAEEILTDALPLIADALEAAEAAAARRRGFLEDDELRDALTALRDALYENSPNADSEENA